MHFKIFWKKGTDPVDPHKVLSIESKQKLINVDVLQKVFPMIDLTMLKLVT